MNDFFSTFNPDILKELRDLIVCTVPRYHCTRYRIIMHHLSLDFNHEVFTVLVRLSTVVLAHRSPFQLRKMFAATTTLVSTVCNDALMENCANETTWNVDDYLYR